MQNTIDMTKAITAPPIKMEAASQLELGRKQCASMMPKGALHLLVTKILHAIHKVWRSRCLPCKGASVQSLRKASQGPQPLAFNPVSSTWVSVIKHWENLLSSYRSWALEHLFTRMLQPTKKIGCDSVPHKQEHLDPRNTDWEVMPRDTKNQGKKISCTLGNINFTHRFWWRKDKQWSNC